MVGAIVLVVLGTAVWALGAPIAIRDAGGPGPAGPVLAPAARRVHLVQPGDTLWSIAVEAAPGGDVRALVDELVERNRGPTIHVGQRLLLP